jgi:outer membrane protein assembly factor BamB
MKLVTENVAKTFTKRVNKILSNATMRALALAILFIISGVGASLLINPAAAAPNASPAAAAPSAAAPAALTQAEANWASPNGNQFGQDYNPQTQINSSNAQYLGLSWLLPLPTHPAALASITSGFGVDTAPLIVNGTIYAVTQFDEVFAINAATGNVVWTDILPITVNSTAALGIALPSLHLHDGNEQFTTTMFHNTPTYWISASDYKVYAINAINGSYELNFSTYSGIKSVAGNNPGALYNAPKNLLVDPTNGIVITSIGSGSSPDTGRCFYRGWNVLVSPPKVAWTALCTPPQPGGNLTVDPSWDISQVNNMSSAEIFYPGPTFNGGGYIPNTNGQAVVNLKTISPSQLNSTLYNDWGYVDQSAACSAYDGGGSTGSTAAGWGAAWLLGSGPTAGMAFVNTNNRDPYNSPCSTGPGLWSAAILALNTTTGAWIWGFQATAHDLWDYDCSWWQAMGNETISGVMTQVIFKTCKDGYLYEINAKTGNLIWAYTPPQSILQRCQYCYMLNPMNQTQMDLAFFNPSLKPTLMYPDEFAAIENEGSYDPALNIVLLATQNVPLFATYIPPNGTNYKTNSGESFTPPSGATTNTNTLDNSTITAVNASTGQPVWNYFVKATGYRGGVTTSGNIVFLTLSAGDLLMLNAATGKLIRDYYIGGPLNVLASIGATTNGTEEIIVPITAGLVTWATGVPGDLVALTLQNVPPASSSVGAGGGSTTTATATSVSTVTAGGSTVTTTVASAGGQSTVTATVSGATATTTVSSGGNSATLYGLAVVAVIFIIATGYLAMRGRKPST